MDTVSLGRRQSQTFPTVVGFNKVCVRRSFAVESAAFNEETFRLLPYTHTLNIDRSVAWPGFFDYKFMTFSSVTTVECDRNFVWAASTTTLKKILNVANAEGQS